MLFHQCLCLFFGRVGLCRFAAFDSHRGLDGLGDFLVQAGADLHCSFSQVIRLSGEFHAANYTSSGFSIGLCPLGHVFFGG